MNKQINVVDTAIGWHMKEAQVSADAKWSYPFSLLLGFNNLNQNCILRQHSQVIRTKDKNSGPLALLPVLSPIHDVIL